MCCRAVVACMVADVLQGCLPSAFVCCKAVASWLPLICCRAVLCMGAHVLQGCLSGVRMVQVGFYMQLSCGLAAHRATALQPCNTSASVRCLHSAGLLQVGLH
jgi:hypothetical protein